MSDEIYKYEIADLTPLKEVEDSLMLAVLTTESVYGRAQVRLDASFCLDKNKRCCVIDASNDVGRHLAKVFTGFLTQEFGDGSFKITRADEKPGPVASDKGLDNKESEEGKDNGQ